jgi:hypothetical protein
VEGDGVVFETEVPGGAIPGVGDVPSVDVGGAAVDGGDVSADSVPTWSFISMGLEGVWARSISLVVGAKPS